GEWRMAQVHPTLLALLGRFHAWRRGCARDRPPSPARPARRPCPARTDAGAAWRDGGPGHARGFRARPQCIRGADGRGFRDGAPPRPRQPAGRRARRRHRARGREYRSGCLPRHRARFRVLRFGAPRLRAGRSSGELSCRRRPRCQFHRHRVELSRLRLGGRETGAADRGLPNEGHLLPRRADRGGRDDRALRRDVPLARRLPRSRLSFRRALRAHHAQPLAPGLGRLFQPLTGDSMRLPILPTLALTLGLAGPGLAGSWDETVAAAKGQTVYWNAWGGDQRTNDFIAWAGSEIQARYGVTITHVKLSDTAEAVTRVIAEKAAGKTQGGAVDLIWINGGNFLSMKEKGLLHGPFLADLPNARYLDLSEGSAAVTDF